MRRVYDSVDVSQSVLGSFFLRVSLGEYDLQSPEDLLKLLVTMARNKVADETRKAQAACRDLRRNESGNVEWHAIADNQSTPSTEVAYAEL
ncbi:hypothetical protein ACSTHC_00255, partial [Vibrio parahaemolyticus]